MKLEFTLDETSLDNIDKNCRLLGGEVAEAICIYVLNEIADPIVEAAVSSCPVGDSSKDIFAGLLSKSIGKTTRRKKRVNMVIVGPMRNKGVDTGKEQYMQSGTLKIPTRYASWQEWGTSHSAPHPFMRPAWDVQGGKVALDRFVDKFEKRLQEAVDKLPNT